MDFDERRRAKWAAGRAERGLTPNDPFQGNPVLEALGETPDLANYVEQSVHEGRIPEDVGRELIAQVASMDMVISLYR
jgi:hypothetical protein